MKEPEQAQAIAGIRGRCMARRTESGFHGEEDAYNDRATLLEIVDSQAQKIAELNEYISQREAGCADCHDIKEHDYEW